MFDWGHSLPPKVRKIDSVEIFALVAVLIMVAALIVEELL